MEAFLERSLHLSRKARKYFCEREKVLRGTRADAEIDLDAIHLGVQITLTGVAVT
jgi:hypothetical protein